MNEGIRNEGLASQGHWPNFAQLFACGKHTHISRFYCLATPILAFFNPWWLCDSHFSAASCVTSSAEVKGASGSGGAAAETKELGHHPKLFLLGVPCWFLGWFFSGQLWRFGPCGVETVTWLSRFRSRTSSKSRKGGKDNAINHPQCYWLL